ncbi:MAG: NAD(P)/FAD-dependent oxidoreductase [Deltaproteobacteria bacterium]|nr:NAD(P)/FAD-dependent oxidoreductase [Deltaproteobacteria bacterium]
MRIVVIGAGIVGLHVAEALRSKGHEVFVLEKEKFLAEHTSGRNSGVIHAGIFYESGSLKEKFCVEGNRLTYEWVKKLKIPFLPCGKLILLEPHQHEQAEKFLEKLKNLKIPEPRWIKASEIETYQPNIRKTDALLIPSSGILDAATYVKQLALYFENQGGQLLLSCEVLEAKPHELTTTRGPIEFDCAINSAGLWCDQFALASGLLGYEIKPCRGDYYVASLPIVQRPIYHLPDPKGLGLGIHFTPTMDNQTLLGPNAFFIEEKSDYHHRSEEAPFQQAIKQDLPGCGTPYLNPGYSGNRPKLFHDGKPVRDFTILQHSNWIHLLGIESPGLTSAPCIAQHVLSMLQ